MVDENRVCGQVALAQAQKPAAAVGFVAGAGHRLWARWLIPLPGARALAHGEHGVRRSFSGAESIPVTRDGLRDPGANLKPLAVISQGVSGTWYEIESLGQEFVGVA